MDSLEKIASTLPIKEDLQMEALKELYGIRIIGHLLNHVQLDSPFPILSSVRETIGGLVEKSAFGTESGHITLIINKNGDIPNQAMFEDFDEVLSQITKLIRICFDEFGDVTISISKTPEIISVKISYSPK